MRNEKDREIYEQVYKKQAKQSKKAILAVFGILGIVFAVLGALLLIFNVVDEDGFQTGIMFLPLGIIWIAVAFIVFFAMPEKGNYEKYKNHVKKYGYGNTYETYATIEMLVLKNEELEKRVSELEEKLKNK